MDVRRWAGSLGSLRLTGWTRHFDHVSTKYFEQSLKLSRKTDYIIAGSVAHAPSGTGLVVRRELSAMGHRGVLYGGSLRKAVESGRDWLPNARWITMREIYNGRSSHRDLIDDRHLLLIERADLVPASIRGD